MILSIGTPTMTLINPPSAPSVHLHVLPESTVGAEVSVATKHADSLELQIWCHKPGAIMECVTEETDEDFESNRCYDCEWHCETVDVEASGQEVEDRDGNRLEIYDDVSCYSPCNAYRDGLSSISFPCYAGHDREDSGETDLGVEHMSYSVILNQDTFAIYFSKQYAFLQKFEWTDDGAHVTEAYECINTFGDHSVCWGDTTPASLMLDDLEITFMASPANEDLCTSDTHKDNDHSVENDDCEDWLENAVKFVPQNHRSKGLVITTARACPSSYVLLTASGAPQHDGIVNLPVYLYPKVQLDADTICDVWVSDSLATGKRLMFLSYDRLEPAVYLGQIDNNFNLEPCKLTQQQSSDVGAQANSLSPV